MSALVIDGPSVATVDDTRTEHSTGHVVVEDGVITAVGAGRAPQIPGARVVPGEGCLLTPGFVNTRHHLYQWATRGLAVDETLFGWLSALYPVWAGIDEKATDVAARGALSWLARTGCTTSTDHHYVFPAGGGDVFAAEVEAARTVGLRFHPCRGSMDLGASQGGLPPDDVVEDRDTVLAATESAIARWHDPAPGSMLRVAVAPCSPFSVTGDLMREAAELARRHGVLLHTHLAETLDEEDFCRERFGCTPLEYVEQLGWLGPDVWFAHAIHLDDAAIETIGTSRTGVAQVLGREDEIGSVEVGKRADLALWRLSGLAHAEIADPVAALVLGSPPPLALLLVDGSPVVEDDRVLGVDEESLAREVSAVQAELLRRAG